MEFQVLGGLGIRREGRFTELSGRLQRTLFAMLLERAGQPVPVDVLTDALWGAQPVPRAGQKLQVHAHRLRRLLGEPERLSFTGGGYRLRVLPGELDAQRFETLVAEAVRATGREPRGTAQSLREALALWQGTPLGDLEVPVLADWAHRLSECRLTALETLYQAELAAGREAEVAGELAGLVRAHPLRERFHGLLMTALYRAGRPADALAAYRAAREVLASELGLEPGPALRGLQRRMLAGAPVGPDGGTPAGACPPAQLPVRVRGFTGREAELAELDRLLLAGGPGAVAVVAGTAGAGKTALAVHWAHRARARFPDGQLYVDLGGYGPGRPAGPEEALAGLLRGLGGGRRRDAAGEGRARGAVPLTGGPAPSAGAAGQRPQRRAGAAAAAWRHVVRDAGDQP